MFKNILVSFDGSTYSWKALDTAVDLAKLTNAQLSLISVEENLPRFVADSGELKEEKEYQNGVFQKLQLEARERVKSSGIDLLRADIRMGHVAKSIIEHAKSIQCDLIIMGHSGRSGAWGNFLGTTAEKVSRYAHCTVMIVR
jgi:nucleotide-binding universal stress UspA family protein